MPSPGSDRQRWHALTAGLLLGLCLALPAQAFSPISGPVLSTTLVAPNVMLLLDSSSSMQGNQLDGQTRLALGRDAVKAAIAHNRHLRFGLFGFREATLGDRGPGGMLLVEAGSISADSAEGVVRFDALNRALDGLGSHPQHTQGAPLAESWYEVTRYLRGMRAYYPQTHSAAAREAFVSPIEYRCQKTVGLIITDGLATHDDQFPDNLLDEPDGSNPRRAGSFNLPDWDGENADLPPGAGSGTVGGGFYLDDIARFAYETDLRQGGMDRAARSWDDPPFARQNLRTYTLGFTQDDPRLTRVASAGNGRYFSASDAAQLQDILAQALRDVSASAGSGGGSVSDSGQLVVGVSRYYQTRFDPSDWSGSLLAYRLGSAGQPQDVLWSTDDTFAPGMTAGTLQTWRKAEGGVPAGGVNLGSASWAALAPGQQLQWDAEALLAGLAGAERGQRLLDWVQGAEDADLRNRTRLLGDVINSAPVLVGAGHPMQAEHSQPGYAAYLQQRRSGLAEAVLVGANDGFLRMFDTHGTHLYSYLPAALHSGMGLRARPDYGQGGEHRSGVDGRLAVADVQLDSGWSTLTAAGLGAGGRGLFTVRLFDAERGAAARGVLWEADADQLDALGHIYAEPLLVNLHGRPVLITGNGYGSRTQQAALLILDLHSGALLRQLEVSARADAVRGNGLSAPVLQADANGQVLAAFAGDLHGQLWKFDLSSPHPANWRVDHAGTPLFTAAEGQPITVAPQLHPGMTGDADLLLFGTGKLLEPGDLGETRVQAFYAVLDSPAPPAGGLTPAQLQRQEVHSIPDPAGGQRLRTVDATALDWSSQYGWYLPLTEIPGERITQPAVIRHSRVMFTTGFIDSEPNDPCRTHAGGWLMTVALASGGMPAATVLDTNADGRVDHKDAPAAGLELTVGLPGALSVIDRDEEGQTPGCGAELHLVQGSAEVAVVSGQTQCQFSRIMWRQLQ